MIDPIQNNEQWGSTREKLNEVIATVNVLAGEYTAKPVFSSIVASLDDKTDNITVSIGFANTGDWPISQLAVEFSTDSFVSGNVSRFYAAVGDLVSGTPLSGEVNKTIQLSQLSDSSGTIYCRAVWAGMVISTIVSVS